MPPARRELPRARPSERQDADSDVRCCCDRFSPRCSVSPSCGLGALQPGPGGIPDRSRVGYLNLDSRTGVQRPGELEAIGPGGFHANTRRELESSELAMPGGSVGDLEHFGGSPRVLERDSQGSSRSHRFLRERFSWAVPLGVRLLRAPQPWTVAYRSCDAGSPASGTLRHGAKRVEAHLPHELVGPGNYGFTGSFVTPVGSQIWGPMGIYKAALSIWSLFRSDVNDYVR